MREEASRRKKRAEHSLCPLLPKTLDAGTLFARVLPKASLSPLFFLKISRRAHSRQATSEGNLQISIRREECSGSLSYAQKRKKKRSSIHPPQLYLSVYQSIYLTILVRLRHRYSAVGGSTRSSVLKKTPKEIVRRGMGGEERETGLKASLTCRF